MLLRQILLRNKFVLSRNEQDDQAQLYMGYDILTFKLLFGAKQLYEIVPRAWALA